MILLTSGAVDAGGIQLVDDIDSATGLLGVLILSFPGTAFSLPTSGFLRLSLFVGRGLLNINQDR